MIKLKTKTNFTLPTKRGVINGIVRMIVERLEIDINNITAIGYYYFIDENQLIIKLDEIKSLNLWSNVREVERSMLSTFNSTTDLKANIIQRLEEFTMLQLTIEANENYGTIVNDWEKDTQ